MRKELKAASEFYDYAAEAGIHPVSLVDAQIIDYLQKTARLLGNTELAKVLSNYKVKDSDQNVLDSLVEVWSKLDQEAEQGTEEEEKKMKDWIEFEGFLMDLYLLKTVTTATRYNETDTRWEHLVIFNENPKEQVMYGNKTFAFRSELYRDQSLEKLKDKLREFTNIRFL